MLWKLKMKVRNRLLNFKNKIIYQNDDYFAFSLDSVLLANFVTINLRDKNNTNDEKEIENLKKSMKNIGYEIVTDRGDIKEN